MSPSFVTGVLVGAAWWLWRRPGVGVGAPGRSGWQPRRATGRRRRGPERQRQELVELLDALAAALASGLPPSDALGVAEGVLGDSSLRPALGALRAAAAAGGGAAPAWRRLTASLPVLAGPLEVVAAAWAISDELGAPLAASVTTAAESVRADLRVQRQVRSATAGARATAQVLAVLPLLGIGLRVLLGADPLDTYTRPLGLACLVLGGLLAAGGWWLMGRLTRAVTGGARP